MKINYYRYTDDSIHNTIVQLHEKVLQLGGMTLTKYTILENSKLRVSGAHTTLMVKGRTESCTITIQV